LFLILASIDRPTGRRWLVVAVRHTPNPTAKIKLAGRPAQERQYGEARAAAAAEDRAAAAREAGP